MACGKKMTHCVCALDAEHEGRCICDCEGSWERTPEGLRIYNFPNSMNGLALLFGWTPGDLANIPEGAE